MKKLSELKAYTWELGEELTKIQELTKDTTKKVSEQLTA